MRKLSEITARIVPLSPEARAFARRPVRAVQSSLTCLVLVKHNENSRQVFVSDDGDPVGAVWLSRAPVFIDPKDRGRFLVVTLTHQLATEKRLSLCLLDWDRYTADERLMLKDAVEAAKRARWRLSGREQPLPFPGRNAFA